MQLAKKRLFLFVSFYGIAKRSRLMTGKVGLSRPSSKNGFNNVAPWSKGVRLWKV